MSSAIVIISAVRVKFFEINIKYRPGIKIYLSLHPLLKYYSETLLFLTLSSIYNFAFVVCKQMEVLPVFLCRAHWPENTQTPMNKQK